MIWDNIFTVQIGLYGFTFGGLLLGTAIVGFLCTTLYNFMHRGE